MVTDNILVTGVGGLIGHATALRLAAAGHRVVGMDRQLPLGFTLPFVSHDLPDLHRWHEVITKHKINKVVHAGGVSGPMLLKDAPQRIIDINLNGLSALLEAARIHGIKRIIGFSSVVAYGDHPGKPEITESSWLNPQNVYGATKAAGDALISAYHAEYGVDAISLRVAGCYGPGRVTPCVVRTLLENGLAGVETLVKEDTDRTRQFIFVDDVVEGVCAALDASSFRQRSYNIGPGVAHTADQLIAAVKQSLPTLRAKVDSQGLAINSFGVGVLKINAARRDFGFTPKTSLEEGVAHTLAWVKKRSSQ